MSKFSLQDWEAFDREWDRTYPGIGKARRRANAEVRQKGYVADRWGRRRRLPGVTLEGRRWPFSTLREEAERQAFSMKIQGGAQGFMERAQIRVDKEVLPLVRATEFWAEGLLQIHDELVMEYDAGAWDLMNVLMLDAMTADSHMLAVPIAASSNQGDDWGQVH